MSSKRKRILYCGGIIAALLVVCVFVFCFLLVDTTTADWSMYGYEISPDGEVSQTLEFTLHAKLREYAFGGNDLSLTILSFPQGTEYSLLDKADYYQPGESENPSVFYPFSYYYYDTNTKGVLSDVGALCLDEKMMILRIDSSAHYIVASADPNADPAEILDYFKNFIGVFAYKE